MDYNLYRQLIILMDHENVKTRLFLCTWKNVRKCDEKYSSKVDDKKLKMLLKREINNRRDFKNQINIQKCKA
jgi:hypothetical protein